MPTGAVKGTLVVSANSITNPTSAVGSVVVAIGDLVYFVLAEQTALTVTTVTDNLGNTYTPRSAGDDAGAVSARAYTAPVTVAGTLTSINAVATASTDNVVAVGVVFAGPFLASPVDANPANITNDLASPFACPSSGTLTQAPELVVAWMAQDGSASLSATAPNVLCLATQVSQAVVGLTIGSQMVGSTSAVAPAFTGTNPGASVLGTTSFKVAPVVGWEQAGYTTPMIPPSRGGGGSPS